MFYFKKAFTLIELIITIIVISILAALAVPKFLGVQRDANVASLIKDMDTLEKVVPVYDTDHNSMPFINDTPATISGELLDAADNAGDSGTQLYELDLSKLKDYHTQLKYGDKSKGSDDYYLYSKETNQVFYVKGLMNSKKINVHCIRQSDGYKASIKNVLLDNKRISPMIKSTIDKKSSYTLTGQVTSGSKLKAIVNGTNVSDKVTYSPTALNNKDKGNIFLKNVYADDETYLNFSVPVNLSSNVTNVLQLSLPEKNVTIIYSIILGNFEPKSINPTLTMSQEQGLTTSIPVTFTVTPPTEVTSATYEWMKDGTTVSDAPNGTFTEGTHKVSVRLKLADGTYSEWVEKSFNVINAANIKQIAAGSNHTLALMNDGTVMAWGYNVYGQLGNGTTTNSITPLKVPGLNNVKQVEAKYFTSTALLNDGTVMAWGRNDYGQLGDGTTTNKLTPVKVSGLTNVKQIATGSCYSFALLNDGTVKAWGMNDYGQLGDGTTTPRLTPVTVSELSNIKQIAANAGNTVALLNDGTVRIWGDNYYGQLGDGTTTPRLTPVTVSGLSNIKQVIAGWNYYLALLNDGTVMAWGCNNTGQLGDGTTTNKLTPVKVSGLNNVIQISAGDGYHSFALLNDGTVMAWGYNYHGQLGDGTTVNKLTPVKVSGLTNVKQIATGGSHSLALFNDGTIRAWGYNGDGELGDGTTTQRLTPVLVQGLK